MKKNFFAGYLLAFGMLALIMGACKGKPSQKTTTDTAVIAPTDNTTTKMPDTTVAISIDDSLKRMIPDATKDFAGVNASVDQGVITLTGKSTGIGCPN